MGSGDAGSGKSSSAWVPLPALRLHAEPWSLPPHWTQPPAPARGQRQPQEPRSLPPHWTQPQARVHICTGAPAQGGGRRGRRARQMRT